MGGAVRGLDAGLVRGQGFEQGPRFRAHRGRARTARRRRVDAAGAEKTEGAAHLSHWAAAGRRLASQQRRLLAHGAVAR